ncbi:MAG: mechanosensitive ion channel family protein [Candidatus Eremiobacteraeota bacterium]|nr:mechanosensitive ion channel family protein [Candidatus Eremiobacteraeota bacterium]
MFFLYIGKKITQFLDTKFFIAENYTNRQVVFAIGTILIAAIVIKIVNYIMTVKLRDKALETKNPYDEKFLEAITGPVDVFIYLIAFYIAITILNPIYCREALLKGTHIFIVVDVVWCLFRLTDIGTLIIQDKYRDERMKMIGTLQPLINKAIKCFIGSIAFIFIVQYLGYSVSSLVAGLGIGGLAVALAAKDTLSNIFGSVTIFLDKPFFIDDWIKVSGVEGIVEDIGFRTTKIRTFAKSLVSIPNSVIANSNVENISRRGMQRAVMNIGVTYNSGADKLEKSVEKIREIIKNHPETNKDSIYIYFSEFKESSLNIFLYFFIESTAWDDFLRARQEVGLSIIKAFENMGIEFAFPTRTIYMEKSENDNLLTKL